MGTEQPPIVSYSTTQNSLPRTCKQVDMLVQGYPKKLDGPLAGSPDMVRHLHSLTMLQATKTIMT